MLAATAVTIHHVKRAVVTVGGDVELLRAGDGDARFEDRISIDALIELWERAEDLTRRRDLPVIAAQYAIHDERSLLAFLVSNQRCFGDAATCYARYFGTVSTANGWRVIDDANQLRLVAAPPGPVHRRGWQRHFEFEVTDSVRSAAAVTAGNAVPLAVRFVHAAPPTVVVGAMAKLLGVTPMFNCARAEVVYEGSARTIALPAARPALGAVVEARLQALLEASSATATTTRVRVAVAELLERGVRCDVDAIARVLNIGRRSLERALSADRTSVGEVLDEERKHRALAWLPTLTVEEVARRLGYSDRRAFARAFRRWTGIAPTQARRRDDS